VYDAHSSPQDLPLCFQEWLDEGIREVLLLPDNRPLITGKLLSDLVARQPAPLEILRDETGHVAVGFVSLDWLVARSSVVASDLDLDAIALITRAPARTCESPGECMAVADLASLAEAEGLLRQRINLRWLRAGVRMVDPATTYVDAGVVIGRGTTILPNSHLWGSTKVGEECEIGPNSILRDADIGHRCTIISSVVEQAIMEDQSDIGPFGHLRKGAHLCRGAHMGNYGEMKNSTLGPGSKMGHFAYLGDATVGKDVNIGAGTITCNYDGKRKHKTVIHDGAFIGSDTMLVAPVEIGAGAKIGAGSVVTHDIPAGAVAYGIPARVRRMIEEGENNGPRK
jgi:bifunctional UDP-N-acetylglucosamine pyrophosphorylase/glucosamine-1-phosphate N-acetyltransferase